MRKLLAVMLAGVLLAAAPAHAEVRGKVQLVTNPDAPRADWLRRPLAGAFVVGEWSITIAAPAHAVTTCRYSEIARSDERGEYVMEGPNIFTASLAHSSFSVYSTGLQQIDLPFGRSQAGAHDITMTWSKLAPAERLSGISMWSEPGCPTLESEIKDPHRVLNAYHQAILDEARTLNVDTERGRRDVAHIEAVIRNAADLDKPGRPLRAVIGNPAGAIQSQKVPSGSIEPAGSAR
jgi:hypothetical protein